MATISLTLPEVATDNEPELFLANERIEIGEVFYLDGDSEANVADNTDSGKQTIAGLALTAADAGNFVSAATGGTVQFGNTLVVGDVYILSTTGDVQLATDLAASGFLSIFATVDTTGSMVLAFNNTGSQKA